MLPLEVLTLRNFVGCIGLPFSSNRTPLFHITPAFESLPYCLSFHLFCW